MSSDDKKYKMAILVINNNEAALLLICIIWTGPGHIFFAHPSLVYDIDTN